jgi:hypothetical protein
VYTRFKKVSFGSAFGGLGTVGYNLYNADGTPAAARSTAGVVGFGGGDYGAVITFPGGFTGIVLWDTGDATPPSRTASEAINPLDDETPSPGTVGGFATSSQRTLVRKWLVNGVLTDVASVVLADPTGSYGVKRADTGTVVIPAGTAMTHAGTGVYSFTDPTLSTGVSYVWYAKITDTDGAVYYEVDTAAAAAIHYGSREGVEGWPGSTTSGCSPTSRPETVPTPTRSTSTNASTPR